MLHALCDLAIFSFELDPMETNWKEFLETDGERFFGHRRRLIWCQASLCAKSLWRLEQSRHLLLIRVFQPQNLGRGYIFPDGNGLVF